MSVQTNEGDHSDGRCGSFRRKLTFLFSPATSHATMIATTPKIPEKEWKSAEIFGSPMSELALLRRLEIWPVLRRSR